MAASEDLKIVLQLGSELRVTNNGEVIVDNPEIELAPEPSAADATLLYHFDAKSGQHVFRLLDPAADHKHTRVHVRND